MSNPQEGGDVAAQGVVLGLHMIVKDEAAVIGRCLDSILPGVDRVMIIDTGSTDGTAEEVDAAIERADFDLDHVDTLSVAWQDSFGQARQDALDKLLDFWPEVTHVVWCDADDIVVGGEHLRAWAALAGPGAPGMLGHYAYGFGPSGELTVSHYRERIVRRDWLTGWEGAIHENLLTRPGPWTQLPVPPNSQLAAPWPRDPAGVEWVHAPTGEGRPQYRNRLILEETLRREDEASAPSIRTIGYLAQEYEIAAAITGDEGDRERWLDRAAEMYQRAEHLAAGREDEHSYQLQHRHADLQRRRGNLRGAQILDEHNVKHLPAWPDAWIGLAQTHAELGEHELALTYVDAGLSKPYPQTGLILNPTDYTVEPRLVRAACLRGLGRLEDASREAQRALAQSPQDPRLQAVAGEYGEEVNRERTLHAVLALDEALARHDENLNALAVLEAAPHFLRAHPEIVQRRVRRRRGLNHLTHPEAYEGWYRDGAGGDAPFEPVGDRTFRETVIWAAESLARTQFLLAGLREQHGDDLSEVSLLDIGCNDGWMGYWLVAEHGLGQYTGLDLFPTALERARQVGEEHYPEVAGRLKFVEGSILRRPLPRALNWASGFDAITCFEVIEHVEDTGYLLDRLGRLAYYRRGTRVYLSTPNGAYERGNITDWDSPTPRGHVRAMRPAELTRLALDRGSLEGFTTGGDRTMCVAYEPRQRIGTIDFFLGPAGQSWSPMDAITKGLGGSETMAIRNASRLAEMGWRVRVFAAVPHEQAAHGVEYLPYWMHDPTEEVDALIVSRIPGYLQALGGRGAFNAGRVYLWLHDAAYEDLERHVDYDGVWCVGEWQARHLFGDRWEEDATVVPNGIGRHDYDGNPDLSFDERAPRVVYSSSPDRGLEHLLQMWPQIHRLCEERGVEPELVIAYGFTSTYEAAAQADPSLATLRARIEAAAASMPGVRLTGSIGQPELHKLQRESRVWAYPTAFPEVSCITAMEAQAAGMAIVATRVAALRDTVHPSVDLWPSPHEWPPDLGSAAGAGGFSMAVVQCLTDSVAWQRMRGAPAGEAVDAFDAARPANMIDAEIAAHAIPAAGRWDRQNLESGDDPA